MTDRFSRSCYGKHKHATFSAASRELNRPRELNKIDKTLKLNVYYCENCHHYHIGKSVKGKHK